MDVTLKPELQEFIADKVRAGEYQSTDALFEAAVARLMLDPGPDLDDATIAAIEEGEAQLDRGEGISLEDAFDRLQKRYGAK